ncbi:MAG: peptide chain release factor N(5)-glutamine methyltransferase [Pseudomonadota bacterium]
MQAATVFTWLCSKLRSAKDQDPWFSAAGEARAFLRHFAPEDADNADLVPVADYPPALLRTLGEAAGRRAGGEPFAYITGIRGFHAIDLAVTPATLIPRPESELLVDAALETRTRQGLSVLDLGTGSGCLLLATLAARPDAWGIGVDCSPAALAVAHSNARRLGLDDRAFFVASDWGDGLNYAFDVVLVNPPYIARNELAILQPGIRHFEPELALDGGPDGLGCYRLLAAKLHQLMKPQALAFIELGAGQSEAVTDLFRGAGYQIREVKRDLSGIQRCLILGP